MLALEQTSAWTGSKAVSCPFRLSFSSPKQPVDWPSSSLRLSRTSNQGTKSPRESSPIVTNGHRYLSLSLGLFPSETFNQASASVRQCSSEREVPTPDINTMSSNQNCCCLRILLHRLTWSSVSESSLPMKARKDADLCHAILKVLLIRCVLDYRYNQRIEIR